MLCINSGNQPPKWLHPSRPVVPFDQVAKQISILFALALMLPILFMNDLLVSPAQDMLVLPSTFFSDVFPNERHPPVVLVLTGTCAGCCSVLYWAAAFSAWWQEFAPMTADFLIHLSPNSVVCVWIKLSLKVACSGSKESPAFAGPCQPNPDEVTCGSWFSGRKPCKSLRRAKEWGKKSHMGRFSCTLNHGGAAGQKCSLAPEPPRWAVMGKVYLGSLAAEVPWLWKFESGAGGEKQGKKVSSSTGFTRLKNWEIFLGSAS